jgi:hypothetical protein
LSPLAKDAGATALPKTLASLALVFVASAGALVGKNIATDTSPVRQRCTLYYDGGYHEVVTVVAQSKATAEQTWGVKGQPSQRAVVGKDCIDLGVSTWEAYVVSPDMDAEPVEQPPSCACGPLDGGCLLVDGGSGSGKQYIREGEFGAGCVRRNCHDWSGIDGTPEACR